MYQTSPVKMSPEKSSAIIRVTQKLTGLAAKKIWMTRLSVISFDCCALYVCFWPSRFGRIFRRPIINSLWTKLHECFLWQSSMFHSYHVQQSSYLSCWRRKSAAPYNMEKRLEIFHFLCNEMRVYESYPFKLRGKKQLFHYVLIVLDAPVHVPY